MDNKRALELIRKWMADESGEQEKDWERVKFLFRPNLPRISGPYPFTNCQRDGRRR